MRGKLKWGTDSPDRFEASGGVGIPDDFHYKTYL